MDYQSATLTIRPVGAGNPAHAAAAMPEPAGAWQVFLSSTVKDLEEYRREVEDALRRRAQVACFLSEDWINSYAETVAKCRDEIEKSRGYIGIFAYWYGSIPTGYEQSITHLEFNWALEKWKGNSYPPIAVLMPKSPSPAEEELKKNAASLVPAEQDKLKKHMELLDGFHKEVTQTWRTVNWFKDQQELREQVLVICLQWKIGRPMDAATGAVEVIEKNVLTRKVTDEEWGVLGRAPQLEAFDRILSQVAFYPSVPAVAILVHGDEDVGQRFFIQQLLTKKKLNSGRPARAAYGRPQSEQYDVKLLTQWAGESLGVLSKGKEVSSPEELADLIFEELQSQQVCFVLDHLHRLAGGVKTFYEGFWRPLYARLAELRKQKPTLNRLIAVVVDYADHSGLPGTMAGATAASAEDYSRLLMLPVLSKINRDDLMEWFDDLEIPDSVEGRRAKLVNLALRNASGEIDGTPFRVFDRLSSEALWPEGEEQ